ncbi:MAG TPA: CheR family methyltransferase [bacterium]|nr:CheR family methyltransferase [bacterium]
MNEEVNPQLEQLLEHVKQSRGFDFTAYKRSSLGRRIEKRMQVLNIANYSDYLEYLKVRADEFTQLFNVILINVTEFFRDAQAWEYLGADILPHILGQKPGQEQIRVWSAGCASGEEAYSAAMLLSEALGKQRLLERAKIYATDVDEDALATARLGRYSEKAVETVPRALLERYFVHEAGVYDFDRDIRRVMIFGRHDLLQDPPISHVDLLLCRNVLMYFNNESQRRVLARLHFAVNEGGYLFLGRAEMLLTHPNLFAAVDLKRRFFAKVHQSAYGDRMTVITQGAGNGAASPDRNDAGLADTAFEFGAGAHVLFDAKGHAVRANERARMLLHLGARDRPRHYRELDLPPEVVRIIDQIYTEATTTRLKDMQLDEVQWTSASGDPAYYRVTLRPLREAAGALGGASLVMEDVTGVRNLQDQLHRSRQELETVSEELQSSNEELETTNEELQSTVEELETTNEELQSTNEELETMNEELQSTNEELHTMNDELRQRGEDLNSVNSFLGSVLSGIREGLIVVDRTGQITAWNPAAEDLWGLRADEVQQKSFFSLDIGLPVDQLGPALRDALGGEPRAITVKATNRRGRAIGCTVQISPRRDANGEVEGAVMLMKVVDTAG